jgi:outer membrane protein TolC
MIDFRIAADRTSQELQEHLLRVTETHWELYRVRCALLQKRKNLAAARDLVEHLTRRQILDVNQSQVQQARAVLATRQAAVIQLETNVRNAEARVRALVNSPLLLDQQGAELVTVENPSPQTFKINLEDALVTTLKERPEFDRVLAEIEAARVKLQVARNELLPVLDAVLDSYVSGLRGNYDIVDAWSDQLQRGEPSYTAGLVYEVPLYRRAARARIERRHLELRQLSSQLQALTENLRTEVEIAARDMETAQRLQLAKSEAVQAAAMNLQALQRRWEILPGDDRSASFLLQDLLDAQDRLNDEEEGLVQAQVETVLSFARLNRATGVMLKLYNNS